MHFLNSLAYSNPVHMQLSNFNRPVSLPSFLNYSDSLPLIRFLLGSTPLLLLLVLVVVLVLLVVVVDICIVERVGVGRVRDVGGRRDEQGLV